jgi:hypothetical protein
LRNVKNQTIRDEITRIIATRIWVAKTKDGKSHFVDGIKEATDDILTLLESKELAEHKAQ